MAAFFNLVLAKIAAALEWIGRLFVAVFEALWHLVTDLVCWGFDGAMGIAVSAVGSLDVSGISANLGAFGSIPAGTMQVLSAIGAGTAFGIVAAALAIRFGLQLIPFVRLGS